MNFSFLSKAITIAGTVVRIIENLGAVNTDKKESAIALLVEDLANEGVFDPIDSSIKNFMIEINLFIQKFKGTITVNSDDPEVEIITITIPKGN